MRTFTIPYRNPGIVCPEKVWEVEQETPFPDLSGSEGEDSV
jgi:hypothetical protein